MLFDTAAKQTECKSTLLHSVSPGVDFNAAALPSRVPSASEDQVEDQDNEQDTSDPDPTAWAVGVVATSATEDQNQHDDHEDQVHRFPLAILGCICPILHHTVSDRTERVDCLKVRF